MEKLTGSYAEDDDLFRPLENNFMKTNFRQPLPTTSRKQRGQILTSKRRAETDKNNMQNSDDQFFEL